ncbi:hypothetical protein DBR18_25075 [Pseudomonas sp. HMWF021]|nr:hypothetical protein DBR18_25075 [Pseudomonas sp. HMWF021]
MVTGQWLDWGHIRCCGNGHLEFRRCGGSLCQTPGYGVWLFWIGGISVAAGVADYGSALTAGHFFQTPKK